MALFTGQQALDAALESTLRMIAADFLSKWIAHPAAERPAFEQQFKASVTAAEQAHTAGSMALVHPAGVPPHAP
jgi:hypothetical protein